MKRRDYSLPLLTIPAVLLLFLGSGLAYAFANGQNASLVIGRPDFTSGTLQTTQNGLTIPSSTAFDSSGKLWAADLEDNRVLEFTPPFSNGMKASLVIGQPDFTSRTSQTTQNGLSSPIGTAFDSSGDLWVTDFVDNRVLEFTPPFSNGMKASVVIGQPDFTSNTGQTTQDGLKGPEKATFDSSGDLWVTDAVSSRVLEFTPPFSNGMKASLVIGKPGFTSSSVSPTQNGLNDPDSATFDSSGNLWVTDGANRVLEFTRPFTIGMKASLVIGQPDFTSNTPQTTQSGLGSPRGASLDTSGKLWVADGDNNRVLEFAPPFTIGMKASLVIGQPDFTSAAFQTTQNGLNFPAGTTFDSSGNLWVVDGANSRVLEYAAAALPTTTNTSGGGGAGIPILAYQLLGAGVIALILSASYLVVRRRTVQLGQVGKSSS